MKQRLRTTLIALTLLVSSTGAAYAGSTATVGLTQYQYIDHDMYDTMHGVNVYKSFQNTDPRFGEDILLLGQKYWKLWIQNTTDGVLQVSIQKRNEDFSSTRVTGFEVPAHTSQTVYWNSRTVLDNKKEAPLEDGRYFILVNGASVKVSGKIAFRTASSPLGLEDVEKAYLAWEDHDLAVQKTSVYETEKIETTNTPYWKVWIHNETAETMQAELYQVGTATPRASVTVPANHSAAYNQSVGALLENGSYYWKLTANGKPVDGELVFKVSNREGLSVQCP